MTPRLSPRPTPYEKLVEAIEDFLTAIRDDDEPCSSGWKGICIDHSSCRWYRHLLRAMGKTVPEAML